jgi:hypothetical protein
MDKVYKVFASVEALELAWELEIPPRFFHDRYRGQGPEGRFTIEDINFLHGIHMWEENSIHIDDEWDTPDARIRAWELGLHANDFLMEERTGPTKFGTKVITDQDIDNKEETKK